MVNTINYGIIGCGMMGQEHIRNIHLLEDTKVSVIFEPDEAMRVRAGAHAPDAKFVDSINALLAHDELDCIVIGSPNHLHVDQIEQIMSSASVPLLVEKPLYTQPEDRLRLVEISRKYQAPIWVAMEYRYMPPMQKFIEELGMVGDLKMLSICEHRFPFLDKVGQWNRLNENTGGTWVEKCCHFFDLMRLIIKSDPVRVMASAGQEVNHLDEVVGGKPSDIWDCGYAIVDFENGCRAMLELSMFAEGSEYQETLHAVGSEGKLEVKIPGPSRMWSGDADKQPKPILVKSPRAICAPEVTVCAVDQNLLDAGDHNGATYYQHAKFLDVVRGNAEVEVTLDDGIWAVRMGHAVQLSAKTGEAVSL